MLKIKDEGLLRLDSYIDGAWIPSSARLDVINPSTGEVIAKVSDSQPADATKAIKSAVDAFKGWSRLSSKTRSNVLRRWYELVLESADDVDTYLAALRKEMLSVMADGKRIAL